MPSPGFSFERRRGEGSADYGKFVTSSDFPWASDFTGLTPGSAGFSEKWRAIVTAHTEAFKQVEHEYIRRTHFDPQIQKIYDRTGVDLRYHSHAINDVVWSTCVQHGAQTDVVVTAMKNITRTAEETKEYDRLLIDAIYPERGKTNGSGALIRFIHSSFDVRAGIKKRYGKEKSKAQVELQNEKDY